MFIGSSCQTFDDRGRVAVPAKLREKLGSGDVTLVLTQGVAGSAHCVDVYLIERWKQEADRLLALDRFDPDVARLRRQIFGDSQETTLDKQGRVLVSPRLRDYARLEKDALFVSDGDVFQIWHPPLWDRVREEDALIYLQDPQRRKVAS